MPGVEPSEITPVEESTEHHECSSPDEAGRHDVQVRQHDHGSQADEGRARPGLPLTQMVDPEADRGLGLAFARDEQPSQRIEEGSEPTHEDEDGKRNPEGPAWSTPAVREGGGDTCHPPSGNGTLETGGRRRRIRVEEFCIGHDPIVPSGVERHNGGFPYGNPHGVGRVAGDPPLPPEATGEKI